MIAPNSGSFPLNYRAWKLPIRDGTHENTGIHVCSDQYGSATATEIAATRIDERQLDVDQLHGKKIRPAIFDAGQVWSIR